MHIHSAGYNERQKVELVLRKEMEQDATYGYGMNGELADVTFGLYAAADIVAADGSIIPADALIEVISISEDGTAKFSADLPVGSFYVKELSTNPAYVLGSEKYPVVFEYAGQETAVVTITVNNGESIGNELIRGNVSGVKKTEDGAVLGGALIGLFHADETEFTEATAIKTVYSAADGSFAFENIAYGVSCAPPCRGSAHRTCNVSVHNFAHHSYSEGGSQRGSVQRHK